VAIGYAGDAIARGQADAMLAGASDALCRLTLTGFNALRLVDSDPCRPFCRTRRGMNIGEAAAVLVLEEMAHARRRGAAIYAELAGYGMRCEAHHATAPEPEGIAVAGLVAAALRASQRPADEVDHVNAHGTATVQNDQPKRAGSRACFMTARAVSRRRRSSRWWGIVWPRRAPSRPPRSRSRSHGVVPPTIHYREPDPDCDLDIVANDARALTIRCGVSTSLAFGGNDAAVVLCAV
jgi:3-oxoacyl-(acyl-carrier-protein) synthase